MKIKKHSLYSAKKAFSKIHLVDKCLLVFMCILLAQSAYGLFVHHSNESSTANLDVIMRTSSAAIFGYFLSANFVRRSVVKKQKPSSQRRAISNNHQESQEAVENRENRIGFEISPGDSPSFESGMASVPTEEQEPEHIPTNHTQIIVATTIGLFCLLVLIILRNLTGFSVEPNQNSATSATIAQFRDFVSGCIGFLIGTPSSTK